MPGEPVSDPSLETLLGFLRDARGFDFTGYKRTTVARRVTKRMATVDVESYAAYLEYLELHPLEFAELFDTMLINVTAFFRDPTVWDHLRDVVIPRLLDGVDPGGTVRVWSAGCASGEETYSLAILLCEALGETAFLERVKIYATDVDEAALAKARSAIYPPAALEALDAGMVDRCFERVDGHFAFRKDLRRAVVFGRNDLVQDAPISRIDLLVCRNTLMYFNSETQARILGRLHFALRDRGFLVLGRSEMLVSHADLFKPLSLQRRIFQRVPGTRPRVRPTGLRLEPEPVASTASDVRDAAFETGTVAQLLVDADGVLAGANARARTLLPVAERDIGRPLRDVGVSFRPVDLAEHVERAVTRRERVVLAPERFTTPAGEPCEVEVEVVPLVTESGTSAAITFADVTKQQRLLHELEASRGELANAYEELQSTVEELETTNEELQSTNEELETTNEELQSTNEELETMNEELQSTNEEIATVNDELRVRTLEIDEVNGFLETILSQMGVAVAVVDRAQVVRLWNGHADELWGVRPDEAIGQHLLSLDIGLPLAALMAPLRDAIERGTGPAGLDIEATNRRGRPITCRVTVLPLDGDDGPTGAVILIQDGAVDGLVDG